jgi:predicted esterase
MVRSSQRALAAALLVFACFSSGASAQVKDAYAFVRADWHLAGNAEYHEDWNDAVTHYSDAAQHADALPLTTREWYRGTADYGIARCYARLHRDSAARASLNSAYRHHFWNTALIRLDSQLVAACGEKWLDSIGAFWGAIRNEEQPTWRDQKTFAYFPQGYDSTAKWPLIIAMHGGNGNYESFAQRWPEIATLVGAVIVVPPGIIRESEITNSWGANMNQIEISILSIAKKYAEEHLIDPQQVYLTGFSQGAQATIELSLRHPEIFRGGIAMSGFASDAPTDSMLSVAKAYGTRLVDISGEYEDPTFRAQVTEIHNLCEKAGIPFQLSFNPGMIHEVPLDLKTKFANAWHWLRGEQVSAASMNTSSH